MKFFISSTYEDLKEIRRLAINMINDLTQNMTGQIAAMEFFPATENTCKEECLRHLSNSDVVIGIYGKRYGSIDKESGLSMTEVEFDHAVAQKKTILAFVLDCTDREEKQSQFISHKVFARGKSCAKFTTSEEFLNLLNNSLKIFFGGLEGYSYSSIWDDIFTLKKNLHTRYDDPMPPFIPGEEIKSIFEISRCAKLIADKQEDLNKVNNSVYDFAYEYHHDLHHHSRETLESDLIDNVKDVSPIILKNWVFLNIGIPNLTNFILLACDYLKLVIFQNKLLYEPWTDELRSQILQVKHEYTKTINTSRYID